MADRIEIYRSGIRRRYRWRYVATNGNILADSGQGYTRRIDALRGAARVTSTRLAERADSHALVGYGPSGEHRPLRVVEVPR